MIVTTHCHIILLALVNLTALSSALSVNWVTRHGLTGTEYQAEHAQWAEQGLNLRCITGYTDSANGENPRYAAVWDNTTQHSQRTTHGVKKSALVTQSDANAADDFQLKFINMYTVGIEILYTAIWEPGDQTGTHLVELTGNEFENAHQSLTALGYELISMSSCNVIVEGTSQDLYSGVWAQEDPSSPANELRFRQSANQYQAEFNNLAGQGYRLICLAPCTFEGALHYNSIWDKPAGSSWWSSHNLEEDDYNAERENVTYQHRRTEYVSMHVMDGKPRFNAVWTDNGGLPSDCIQILNDGIINFMENNDTPGISLAIMKDGRLIFAKGYGRSDHVSGRNAAQRARPCH